MAEWLDRWRLRRLRSSTHLVVVAHPDDETLWAGATIAATPGTGVLCLTNRGDRVRRTAFTEAMRSFGASGVILDVPDRRSAPTTVDDDERITRLVTSVLGRAPVTRITTHGPEGEYGHPLHQRVSALVTAVATSAGVDLWYFDFASDAEPQIPPAKAAALAAYFPPDRPIPESDRQHMRLSALERPSPASSYAGASSAIAAIYGGEC